MRINVSKEKPKAYDFRSTKNRQRALKKLGFHTGTADGIWGPKTEAAVIKKLG